MHALTDSLLLGSSTLWDSDSVEFHRLTSTDRSDAFNSFSLFIITFALLIFSIIQLDSFTAGDFRCLQGAFVPDTLYTHLITYTLPSLLKNPPADSTAVSAHVYVGL